MKGKRDTNLCVDSGLDDVDHHVCGDGVRLEIESTDGFVGLILF